VHRWVRQLRVRVALLLAGCSLLVLLVLFALVVPPLRASLQNSRRDRLASAVRGALPELASDIGAIDPNKAVDKAELLTSAHVQVWLDFGSTSETTSLFPVADSHGAANTDAPSFARDAFLQQRPISRFVDTGGRTLIEYAVPFTTKLGNQYVALFSAPMDTTATVDLVKQRLLIAAGVALVLAIFVAFLAAQTLILRVRRLQAAAERITAGEFHEPVVDATPDELGDLARSFDSMRIQLERLDRARKAFVANASHELRTPLTSLGGYVELLGEGGLDAETRDEFLATMGEQVERLTKLASDLLDLSRLDAGEVHVSRESVDLAEVATSSAREAQAVAARRGAQLHVSLDSPTVRAVGDEGRVRQIVRALVDNAVKHTPAGTNVTLTAAEEDGTASLSVVDDGPGIQEAALAHLFERFYRAPGAAPQGSGLGLAIAHELAARMGGRLVAESEPGRTAFTLELPIAVPSRDAAALGTD
jgi:signal transduction histidine kinase